MAGRDSLKRSSPAEKFGIGGLMDKLYRVFKPAASSEQESAVKEVKAMATRNSDVIASPAKDMESSGQKYDDPEACEKKSDLKIESVEERKSNCSTFDFSFNVRFSKKWFNK